MKYFCPKPLTFAVIRLNPVAMVQHFNDPDLTARAQAIKTKKYLAFLDSAIGLPMPGSAWFNFYVALVATTLRHPDTARGITPDMVLPIYPNTDNARGCEPFRLLDPFPFPNCYFWADSSIIVRIRRSDDEYDDSQAVHASTDESLRMTLHFQDDFIRAVKNRSPINPVESVRKDGEHRTHVSCPPASEHTPPPASSVRGDLERAATPEHIDSIRKDDAHQLAVTERANSFSSDYEDDDDTIGIAHMDLFGVEPDLGSEQAPLVDLWNVLTDYLTADTIPSPVDFFKECEVIKAIVREGRSRYPWIAPPCINEELRKMLSESTSDISEYSARLDDEAHVQSAVPDAGAVAEQPKSAPDSEGTAVHPAGDGRAVTGQPASDVPAAAAAAPPPSSSGSVDATPAPQGINPPRPPPAALHERMRRRFAKALTLRSLRSGRPPFLPYWQ
ncbi:hypothetical protein C8Q77DRAFT_1161182 [Trametes polyzona]|nr:hypothetical protein C8Q77DRAFT_1161182 [Trametes polyzona]